MNDKYLAEARRILVDIAKHKGVYDDSFTNFLVTPEELAPYLAKQDRESRKEFEKAIVASVWDWRDGWRFCDEKFTDLSEKFQQIILDNLGNHPIGNYVYSDDCACQIDGMETFDRSCGCICHKKAREFAKVVMARLTKQDPPQEEKR